MVEDFQNLTSKDLIEVISKNSIAVSFYLKEIKKNIVVMTIHFDSQYQKKNN